LLQKTGGRTNPFEKRTDRGIFEHTFGTGKRGIAGKIYP
jgi:hypothetical protein